MNKIFINFSNGQIFEPPQDYPKNLAAPLQDPDQWNGFYSAKQVEKTIEELEEKIKTLEEKQTKSA